MKVHHVLAAYIVLVVVVVYAVAAIEQAAVASLFHLPVLHVGGRAP